MSCSAFVLWSCAKSNVYRKDQALRQRLESLEQEQVELKGKLQIRLARARSQKKALSKSEGKNKEIILKKSTVLLPFWNSSDKKGDVPLALHEEILEFLESEPEFKVIHRDKIFKVSRDFYNDKKEIKLQKLVKLGMDLDASLIVMGRIGSIHVHKKDESVGFVRPKTYGLSVELEARLISINDARQMAVIRKRATKSIRSLSFMDGDSKMSQDIYQTMLGIVLRDATRKILSELPRIASRVDWQGKIAKVDGDKIYITAGQSTGLELGDILKVVSKSEDILDPQTGRFLGKTRGTVKGTVEITGYFGTDGSITRLHSGGSFQRNDTVRLY